MSNKKEILGFRLELIGLIVLLIGAFWKSTFSDIRIFGVRVKTLSLENGDGGIKF